MAIHFIATLTYLTADLDRVRAYELQAVRVMARHGGRIERALYSSRTPATDQSTEVHVVCFEDESGIAAYRSDPEILGLSDVREACIIGTTILRGEEVDYSMRTE